MEGKGEEQVAMIDERIIDGTLVECIFGITSKCRDAMAKQESKSWLRASKTKGLDAGRQQQPYDERKNLILISRYPKIPKCSENTSEFPVRPAVREGTVHGNTMRAVLRTRGVGSSTV